MMHSSGIIAAALAAHPDKQICFSCGNWMLPPRCICMGLRETLRATFSMKTQC